MAWRDAAGLADSPHDTTFRHQPLSDPLAQRMLARTGDARSPTDLIATALGRQLDQSAPDRTRLEAVHALDSWFDFKPRPVEIMPDAG